MDQNEFVSRMPTGAPQAQGLYDPAQEHDSCGIGFVVNIKGRKSHEIVSQSLTILNNMSHRGGAGYERNSGDGAGILKDAFDQGRGGGCRGCHDVAGDVAASR